VAELLLFSASRIPAPVFGKEVEFLEKVRCCHENDGLGSSGQPSIYACRAAISYFTKPRGCKTDKLPWVTTFVFF